MPQGTNYPTSSIVLFKEPAMPHPVTDQHTPKRLTGSSRLLLGLMLAVWIAIALPATPTQAADTCPNAELRALNNSSGLPDCRAYEMVTNSYKQGFDVIKPNYGDDGAVAYLSLGNFADNPYGVALFNQYVARRSATGWKTISLNPPGEQWVFGIDNGASGAVEGLSVLVVVDAAALGA